MMGSGGRRAAGGSAEHRDDGDRPGQPQGALGMGTGMPFPTLIPSRGGKVTSFPREEAFSVRSDPDPEEKLGFIS